MKQHPRMTMLSNLLTEPTTTADKSMDTADADAAIAKSSACLPAKFDADSCCLFLPFIGDDERAGDGRNVPRLTGDDDDGNSSCGDGCKISDKCDNIGISPFIVYEKQDADEAPYSWPDLHTEMSEMLEASALVYAVAELRRKVRDNKAIVVGAAGGAERAAMMKMPITLLEIASFVEKHPCDVHDTKFAMHFYVNILEEASKRDRQQQQQQQQQQQMKRKKPRQIVAFDDEFEAEEDVYSIDIDHTRERVTVSFRGAVTRHDWSHNMETYMKDTPNPVYHEHRQTSDQDENVRVHSGFYDYMFKQSWRGVKGPNGEALSQFQEIMQDYVRPVMKDYPHYKLYATGHSMGGALATLFAFQVASIPDSVIPKPVSLFTFGGPYVGDESFRVAHRWLERRGKLRHARVVNHKDVITTLPAIAFKWNILDPSANVGTLFKHVGMNVRLFEDGDKEPEFSYPKARTGFLASLWDELARGWDQALCTNFSWSVKACMELSSHELSEYGRRLEISKSKLETTNLNDLYARKDLVGNLVADF